METFVFRNHTIEAFFGDHGVTYSGYDDISVVPQDTDRYIWFYQVPVNADAGQLAQEINSFSDKLGLVASQIGDSKPLVIFSLVDLFPLRLTGNDGAVANAIADFNSNAMRMATERPNVKWVDFTEFTARFDQESLINWKYFFMMQSLLNPKLAHDFQLWWKRVDEEMDLKRRKCLVLDLDNTLWGGVLGEDGVDGILLGGDYPGNAFTTWQYSLLQLERNGVILAVCSKNNEADVFEAWENNPHMVLKREHFSAMRINWNDKVTSLTEIADELNIGLDSMVFIDDNPAERELVKQMLPQVIVPDFPEKPYQLMTFYKELVERYFRIYEVTDEDRAKTVQYRANTMRRAERSRFDDFDSYLYSLDIQMEVIPADDHNLPRIAQMTQKTNQFNLTTHRYSEADLRQQLDKGWHIYCLSVSDRFGDSGITGTVILNPITPDCVEIDTFLLSCRILGKGIEEAFIKTVLNLLRLDGYRKVAARYFPTLKNVQTADFYDRMGLTCVETGTDGTKRYELQLKETFDIKNCYNIRVL